MGVLATFLPTILAAGFALAASLGLWPGIDAELRAMAAAGAATVGVALFLLPAAVERRALGRLAGSAAAAGALAFALALAAPGPRVTTATAAALGLAAALLTATAGAFGALLRPLAPNGQAAVAWPSAVLLVVAAGPVWLGPVVYRTDPAQPLTDAVIAASPLTHLAVAGGVDYLRSDWFYRNAPFGALRYEYPGLAVVVAGYAAAGALAWGGAGILARPRPVAPPVASHP
jgi:hypothetical protein